MRMKVLVVVAAVLAIPELALAQAVIPGVGSTSGSASGWLAGAQAGYNWQSGSVVYGLEADIAGMNLKSSMNTVLQGGIGLPATATTSSTIDWCGTARGRLGWATGPVMIYGTGGLAYAGSV